MKRTEEGEKKEKKKGKYRGRKYRNDKVEEE